ncbi:uncharacterized protein LOC127593076 [Hippocampus zosterae]|uniref:uncharacterized protein LOC127593076 n=1 Tax=Hippocampus zosterae TaxID=109293 RepID=UPI00223DAFF7|nr:uncharacterized protein LOC127593076 [Hippocampus zosterae]
MTSLLIAMVLSMGIFIVTLVFSFLAARGQYPFLETTGNISDAFATHITPSGWTFIIWTFIYIFLALVMVYAFAGLCRRNALGLMYCCPPVLSHGFYLTWCLNFGFNIGWLFVWDRRLVSVALAFLIVVTVTNFAMIFFSCCGLHIYGAWLHKFHRVDLWLVRVLVQNGIAMYATWTTIASLLNLAIVLNTYASLSQTSAATISLAILVVVVFVWFVLENFFLDKHVRYILVIYPVVIWALIGSYTKNYDAESPSQTGIFAVVVLAAACVLFATRIILVVWRHIKSPIYKQNSVDLRLPVDIINSQRNILFK